MRIFFILTIITSSKLLSQIESKEMKIQLSELKKAYRSNDSIFFNKLNDAEYIFVFKNNKPVHIDIPSEFIFSTNWLYYSTTPIRGEYGFKETTDGFICNVYTDYYNHKSFQIVFNSPDNFVPVRFKQNKKKKLTPRKSAKYSIIWLKN